MTMDLNEDLQRVETELEDVRNLLEEEISDLFNFDVIVENIDYNARKNSVSLTVEPAPNAENQLSERLGGVDVVSDGQLAFEYVLAPDQDEA